MKTRRLAFLAAEPSARSTAWPAPPGSGLGRPVDRHGQTLVTGTAFTLPTPHQPRLPPNTSQGSTDLAVRTTWTIDHQCGHQIDHDLSARRADERAGYARWLEARACTDCWRTAHKVDATATQEWIASRREQELADAAAWAAQYDMPPLAGSDKAVAWGERCRHQLVTAAYRALVAEGECDEQGWVRIEETARLVDRAGWWIDQRDADPRDLPELLAAATGADRSTENPYH